MTEAQGFEGKTKTTKSGQQDCTNTVSDGNVNAVLGSSRNGKSRRIRNIVMCTAGWSLYVTLVFRFVCCGFSVETCLVSKDFFMSLVNDVEAQSEVGK